MPMKTILVVFAAVMSLNIAHSQPRVEAKKFHRPASLKPAAKAISVHTPDLDPFPIASGWPLALPGYVMGAPVVADLGGDGQLEIIVPCMASRLNIKIAHPEPDIRCQLFAFHYDGTPVDGWPAILLTDEQRQSGQTGEGKAYADNWFASPSVLPLERGDEIVITCPDEGDWVRSVRRVNSKGAIMELTNRGDGWGSVPLADVNNDAVYDVLVGEAAADVEGAPLQGWPIGFKLPGGYAPCIGDANGDGTMEIYHPNYERDWAQGNKDLNWITAYDNMGKPLPGWPQKLGRVAEYVVMGDVSGDSKMEIISLDVMSCLNVWTWDGKPAPGTKPIGEAQAVLRTGLNTPYTPLTLADLDGDGKAEILCLDPAKGKLYAWHGDGSGVTNPSGSLADIQGYGGVTVADLAGDGVMDIFAATKWIKLFKDGHVEIQDLLPTRINYSSSATICDANRDGNADLLMALPDGRVFVYETGLSYKPEWVQWATQNGNFQHTGAWTDPRKIG